MNRHVLLGPSRSKGHSIRQMLPFAVLLAVAATSSFAGEVRVIRGPGLAPPPVADAPRERIEPVPRPTEPRKIVRRRLPLVAYESTSTLAVGDLRVVLTGVAPLAVDERCVDPAGVEWSCGGRVLAAARFALRRKPVDCDLPDGMKRGRYDTSCSLDGVDLADLVVRRGWARAAAGGSLEEAEEEARREGRGLHGNAPPVQALPPNLSGGDHILPADLTTAPLSPQETGPSKRETAPAPGAPMPLDG